MYSIIDFGEMLADRVRTGAYVRALERSVRPGMSVLDIGTGTGYFAFVACRLGARHVYAIEPNPAIEVAKQSAAANGFADRITFIQAESTEVELPEQVDVIVSDLRGMLPLYNGHLSALIDARARFLAPGGTLIPEQDDLMLTVVEAEALYQKLVGPWTDDPLGLDLGAARASVIHTLSSGRVTPDGFLAEPACWTTLNYHAMEQTSAAGAVAFRILRDGTGHGLSGWFVTRLMEGIRYASGPADAELATVYNQAFFPWPSPVPVSAGDVVEVSIRSDQIGDAYHWRWATQVLAGGDSATPKARFDQSTFHGVPLSLDGLRAFSADYRPALSPDGEFNAFLLPQLDGQTPSRILADRLIQRFPGRFRDWDAALTYVGGVAKRYGG